MRVYESDRHVTDLGAQNGTRIVPADTVLFVVRGMSLKSEFRMGLTTGKVAFNQDLKAIIPSKDIDARFLAYALRSKEHSVLGMVDSAAHGTGKLPTDRIGALGIGVPRPAVQKKIVGVLSAYDDLIENNNRRKALLEESVHLLYREWFVYLRFPGHERVEVVEGVPAGWSYQTLEALCVDESGVQTGPFGSQLHKSDYTDEGIPVVMPKQMKGNVVSTEGIARIPPAIAARLSRHVVEQGDILYARRGDITRRAFVSVREAGWFCGTGCLRLRPDASAVDPRFLFETLGTGRALAAIEARATGATMLNLSAKAMKQVEVLMPPESLQSEFVAFSRRAKTQVETLQEQNRKLREARDLLLPRLMDGRIPV
jgi:type I restriction enzyme S subunit